MRDDRDAELRVGVLGHGAIGSKVAGLLRRGEIPGARLTGVLVRGDGPVPLRARTVRALVESADVVVEAAGQQALWDHGAEILDAGCDLVAVSVGALADDGLFRGLTGARGAGAVPRGRLLVCPGALGGLDVVRAATIGGPLISARLTSSKLPGSLVQPWMDEGTAARLRALRPGDEPVVVHDGPAREAAIRFPRNANVAATLALAAGDWSAVRVRLVADPGATLTRHVVEFRARIGEYRFELGNLPDADNPATSGLVPYAVARTLADLVPGTAWRIA